MKKLMLMLAMGISVLSADSGEYFKFEGIAGGGLVGDTMTYIYKKNGEEIPKSSTEVNMLSVIAKKKVCSNKVVKEYMNQGLKVQYIYLGTDDFVIVNIDSCD
jgi:hypothetical protein